MEVFEGTESNDSFIMLHY